MEPGKSFTPYLAIRGLLWKFAIILNFGIVRSTFWTGLAGQIDMRVCKELVHSVLRVKKLQRKGFWNKKSDRIRGQIEGRFETLRASSRKDTEEGGQYATSQEGVQ